EILVEVAIVGRKNNVSTFRRDELDTQIRILRMRDMKGHGYFSQNKRKIGHHNRRTNASGSVVWNGHGSVVVKLVRNTTAGDSRQIKNKSHPREKTFARRTRIEQCDNLRTRKQSAVKRNLIHQTSQRPLPMVRNVISNLTSGKIKVCHSE